MLTRPDVALKVHDIVDMIGVGSVPAGFEEVSSLPPEGLPDARLVVDAGPKLGSQSFVVRELRQDEVYWVGGFLSPESFRSKAGRRAGCGVDSPVDFSTFGAFVRMLAVLAVGAVIAVGLGVLVWIRLSRTRRSGERSAT